MSSVHCVWVVQWDYTLCDTLTDCWFMLFCAVVMWVKSFCGKFSLYSPLSCHLHFSAIEHWVLVLRTLSLLIFFGLSAWTFFLEEQKGIQLSGWFIFLSTRKTQDIFIWNSPSGEVYAERYILLECLCWVECKILQYNIYCISWPKYPAKQHQR